MGIILLSRDGGAVGLLLALSGFSFYALHSQCLYSFSRCCSLTFRAPVDGPQSGSPLAQSKGHASVNAALAAPDDLGASREYYCYRSWLFEQLASGPISNQFTDQTVQGTSDLPSTILAASY